jgi:hypothetical protein
MSATRKFIGRPKGRRKARAHAELPPLAVSVAQFSELVGLSRDAAYKLARKLGRRVGGKRGRLIVPLAAVHAWLSGRKVAS